MLKIGLTGGIGSGKTAVAKIFSILGVPVFYADIEAKLLMEKQPLVAGIKQLFGEESYIKGKLNRPFIANIVFGNVEKLRQLNALVHPATIEAANNWIKLQRSPYIIKEAALLFEAGSAAELDYIIGVSATAELRIKRVMARDGVAHGQVLSRMQKQLPEEEKMAKCDFVILNNQNDLLIPQVVSLHEKLKGLPQKTLQ